MRGGVVALVVLVSSLSCGSPAASPAKPAATAPIASADAMAQLRARGSVKVVIRVGVSPGGQQLDVAHSQKRAFESAIATDLVKRVLGPQTTVQFVELGRDRWNPVEQGTADIAMISAAEGPAPNVVLTPPYARGAVVIAVKRDSTATEPRALAGQRIAATTMGEINAAELADGYLKEKRITATIASFPGLAAAVAALDAGQVSAVVGDLTGIEVLQRGRAEPLRVVGELASRPYVVAVHRGEMGLHAALSAAIKDLVAGDEARKIATATAFPYQVP